VALPGDCGLGTEPRVEFTDDFESGVGLWTHSGTQDTWTLSGSMVHGGSFAWYAQDPDSVSDQRLVSPPVDLPSSGSGLTLQYWNHQEMESSYDGCYDGGILEISTDGGATWTQLPTTVMQTDPYDGTVSSSYSNPLAGLQAWCGDPQDWLRSVADINAYAGHTVNFRFRLGSDSSVNRDGWHIDDLKVQSCVVPDPPFFADDFESGTTDAWSVVMP
jgi:lysyl endopeptidase